MLENKKIIGIYIHIPFCDIICNYCDFTVFQGASSKYRIYVEILKKEIKLRKNKNYIVDTIFIGGGTPSILNANYIYEILQTLNENFTVLENIEITIETNPKTLDLKKLETYKKSKINRISIGIQSFNDYILTKLGRNHNSIDAIETINLVSKFDFSVNFDLIFGYEKQNFKMLNYDLEMIEKFSPDHISYYSLIIEDGTKFGSMYKLNKMKYMEDEKERKMYKKIVQKLEEIGINQYEISNFSKKGKQSAHNKKYWKCKEYLSFGVGAHSYIDNKRFSNTKIFSKYLSFIKNDKFPVDFEENLDLDTRKFEKIIMNMRLNEGMSFEEYNFEFNENFEQKYGEILKKYISTGVVVVENDMLKFTDYGRNITDLFFLEFAK